MKRAQRDANTARWL